MMEYKVYKWSDVLTIINGRNQNAVECEDGEYPIYGSGGVMGKANDYLCPPNCTIIGRKGNINKPIYVETKFWNVDTAFGLSANEEILNPRYLYSIISLAFYKVHYILSHSFLPLFQGG